MCFIAFQSQCLTTGMISHRMSWHTGGQTHTNTHTHTHTHIQNGPFQNKIYYRIIITDALMLQLVNTELILINLYILCITLHIAG